MPLGKLCVELPAGLIGDETQGEAAAVRGRRELEEIPAIAPRGMTRARHFHSSPGMVSEASPCSAPRADQGERGGGVAGEDIVCIG